MKKITPKVTPISDNILIKRTNATNKTASGIILATVEEKMEKGVVIAVGEEVNKVKKGDKILFKNYSIDIVEVDGEEFNFIKGEHILGIYVE